MTVLLRLARGPSGDPRRLQFAPGARIRDALRAAGVPPEGSAVLVGDRPVPLDTELRDGMSLVVVPTFSGG